MGGFLWRLLFFLLRLLLLLLGGSTTTTTTIRSSGGSFPATAAAWTTTPLLVCAHHRSSCRQSSSSQRRTTHLDSSHYNYHDHHHPYHDETNHNNNNNNDPQEMEPYDSFSSWEQAHTAAEPIRTDDWEDDPQQYWYEPPHDPFYNNDNVETSNNPYYSYYHPNQPDPCFLDCNRHHYGPQEKAYYHPTKEDAVEWEDSSRRRRDRPKETYAIVDDNDDDRYVWWDGGKRDRCNENGSLDNVRPNDPWIPYQNGQQQQQLIPSQQPQQIEAWYVGDRRHSFDLFVSLEATRRRLLETFDRLLFSSSRHKRRRRRTPTWSPSILSPWNLRMDDLPPPFSIVSPPPYDRMERPFLGMNDDDDGPSPPQQQRRSMTMTNRPPPQQQQQQRRSTRINNDRPNSPQQRSMKMYDLLPQRQSNTQALLEEAERHLNNDSDCISALGWPIQVANVLSQSTSSLQVNGTSRQRTDAQVVVQGSRCDGVLYVSSTDYNGIEQLTVQYSNDNKGGGGYREIDVMHPSGTRRTVDDTHVSFDVLDVEATTEKEEMEMEDSTRKETNT